MKIKDILFTGAIAATLTLGLASCSDELDALPTQSKVDGNVVVDQKSAKATLNGVYYKYANCGEDYYNTLSTGCASHLIVHPADVAGIVEYYQGPYTYEVHGSGYYNYDAFWTYYYSMLPSANGAIEQIGNADDAWFSAGSKQEMLGEAHFLRAMMHYHILCAYGYYWDIDSPYGIILRTEAAKSSNIACPRSTVRETYEQILSDLDYAIANCPDENPNHYANKWVAKGMKARVLMMRGAQGDYDAVLSLTQDIIANAPYAMENMVDVFHAKGLASTDVMFGVQPKANQRDVWDSWSSNGGDGWLPTPAFQALFDGDPRKEQIIAVNAIDDIVYDFDDAGNFIGYHWETVEKAVVRKHIRPGQLTFDNLSEQMPLMRLTEMYMLRAEAFARKGQLAEAKAALGQVLAVNGYTDMQFVDDAADQTAVLRLIFQEMLRNLSCESGLELPIMMRYPKEIVTEFSAEYSEEKTQYAVFPIPAEEFENNNLLPAEMQNPGYSVDQTNSMY